MTCSRGSTNSSRKFHLPPLDLWTVQEYLDPARGVVVPDVLDYL